MSANKQKSVMQILQISSRDTGSLTDSMSGIGIKNNCVACQATSPLDNCTEYGALSSDKETIGLQGSSTSAPTKIIIICYSADRNANLFRSIPQFSQFEVKLECIQKLMPLFSSAEMSFETCKLFRFGWRRQKNSRLK